MEPSEFDVIVIGAGLGGLCCAGELVLGGKRVLLVCETKQVGATFATRTLGDGNTGFLQHLIWQRSWGEHGGWWYGVARRLNIPLRLYPEMEFEVRIAGTDLVIANPTCVSSAALADVLAEAFPIPDRDNLERVLRDALALSYEELIGMQDVLLSAWLTEHGANQVTEAILLALAGQTNDLKIPQAREMLSVFGGLGLLRILLCGEGSLPIPYPHIRDGLCIPIAEEIERRGGVVSRGRKVTGVETAGGVVGDVVFADGSRANAPVVAMATGNPRIPALLDPVPAELTIPLKCSADIDMIDYNMYYLTNKRIVEDDRKIIGMFDPATFAIVQQSVVVSGGAPWVAEPGKQVILSHIAYTPDEVAGLGGDDAVYEAMTDRTEELYPGLRAALEDSKRQSHRHHWFNPISVHPKIPRTVDSVAGLYFVGDGSGPCEGIWTEAAASCGVLGARQILTDLG